MSEKVTLPKFVVDWLESIDGYNIYGMFNKLSKAGASSDVLKWFFKKPDINSELLARAKLDGYEIEEPPLYTVEIPNPNSCWGYTLLGKKSNGKVALVKTDSDKWVRDPIYQLTEEEIKQDFKWAWDLGFAKLVEDNKC